MTTECWRFMCNYTHENRYGQDICQYSDEPCDVTFTAECCCIPANLCEVCQCTDYCGLATKGGDSE